MKTKKPASRRKRVDITVGTEKAHIEIVPGAQPYLWVGSCKPFKCYGVVKDSEVRKLRDLCDEILERSGLEGFAV